MNFVSHVNLLKTLRPGKALMFFLLAFFLVPHHAAGQEHFSVGAQYRARLEMRNGYQRLRDHGSTPAVFVSHRARLSFVYENDLLRLRLTPQDVRVWGDEEMATSTGVFGDRSSLDIFEAFVELRTGKSSWFSIGRQPLNYDNGRLLSVRNWNQNGLAYDAVVFKWNPSLWEVHAGGTWNSTGENLSDNLYDPARIKSLVFLWAKHRFNEQWNLSLLHVAAGATETDDANAIRFRHTTGFYTMYANNSWMVTANVFYQYGRNNRNNKVSAMLADAEASFKPGRLGAGAGTGYLSGNSKTGDEQSADRLFDVLYGGRHGFFGMMDYFRNFRQDTREGGLVNYYLFLSFDVSEKTNIRNTFHHFRLAQTNPLTPDNKNLGFENDLLATYKFGSWGSIAGGYAFFLPERSLKIIQDAEDAQFSHYAYLQLTITPTLFK